MSKRIVLKKIHGFDIFLRDQTPDANVADSSLGKEFEEICKLLADVVQPHTILDLGGYIGSAAMKFASAVPHATVITVEPSPDNFRVLQLNTARYPNIVPVHAAVGSKTGQMKLYNRGTGEWGFTLVENPKDQQNPEELAVVDVLTIADLMARHSPAGNIPSLVKIDIEGGEVDLLSDSRWMNSFAIATAELHDRIVDGCTTAWHSAVAGGDWVNVAPIGEKLTSINPRIVRALHTPPKKGLFSFWS